MIEQRIPIQLPQKMLTCTLCSQLFTQPITLICGHTFCRECLLDQVRQSTLQQGDEPGNNKIQMRYKIHLCTICQEIIWKVIPQMHENITIKNVINRCYPNWENRRKKSREVLGSISSFYAQESGENYYNKILIRIRQQAILPMPSCLTSIEFQTNFIEDISEQAKSLVITWGTLFEKKIGLFGSLKNIQQIHKQKAITKIIINQNQINEKKWEKRKQYKGIFYGIQFVVLTSIELLKLNHKNKINVMSGQQQQPIVKQLQICHCSIFHSKNYNTIRVQQFTTFFRFYDNMNDYHCLQQIRSMISDIPFQTRDNTQMMIYCVLRILRLPNEMRKKLLLSFDDSQRILTINNWLLANQNQTIDTVMNIKIPGKYNFGIVLFIIFMLFAFNLFQDYNRTKSNT